jgi:hypothetical protein
MDWITGAVSKDASPELGKKPRSLPPSATDTIPEGSRNAELASIAGRLRWAGLDADSVERELLLVNQKRCAPPLPASEVAAIARSISRYPAGSIPRDSQDAGLSREELENFVADQNFLDEGYLDAVADEISMQELPQTLGHPLNDSGNAALLFEVAGVDFKFSDFWFSWSGSAWEQDFSFRSLEKTGLIPEILLQQARSLEGAVEPGEDGREINGQKGTNHDGKREEHCNDE